MNKTKRPMPPAAEKKTNDDQQNLYKKYRIPAVLILPALVAGLTAALLATVTMGLLRVYAGVPTPVELFGTHILKNIDVDTFIRLLLTFAPYSKTRPLGLALAGMIGLGTALGLLYARIARLPLPVRGYRPGRREWLTALSLTLAMTLAGLALFWYELPANFAGLPFDQAMITTALGLLLDFSVYGIALAFAYRLLLPQQPAQQTTNEVQKRRQLFSRAGVAALAVGSGAGVYGLVQEYLKNYTAYDGTGPVSQGGVTLPITPNDQHYVVTQNTVDPFPDVNLWRLEMTGLINKPGTYTYAELQNLPSISRAVTLECISNGVGRQRLMSTAIWQGVPFSTLLERHGGVAPGAKYVAFYSVDGYTISQPLDEVLRADTLLAWRMNGEVLPRRHGFPLRVLIPGHYGEENPKWLTRIELTDHFVGGLYANQGWYYGPLHMTSRIDRPNGQIALGRAVEVAGIAFSGYRGIQKVELSVDGGATWRPTTLQPPLSKDSWVFWSTTWTPTRPGTYTLQVRATDGTGEVQTSKQQGTVPNGATGYHTVSIVVK